MVTKYKIQEKYTEVLWVSFSLCGAKSQTESLIRTK